jgi:hypothetical protein
MSLVILFRGCRNCCIFYVLIYLLYTWYIQLIDKKILHYQPVRWGCYDINISGLITPYQPLYSVMGHSLVALLYICSMNAFFSFDLFIVYIPECKQQL